MIKLVPIQITLVYTTKPLHRYVSELITSKLKIIIHLGSSKNALKT